MANPQYETTLGRASVALLGGATCGSVLVTLLSLGPREFAMHRSGLFNHTWSDSAAIAASVSAIYLAAYACGLLAVATPVWWLLHKMGHRCRPFALILGIVLSIVSYFAIGEWFLRSQGKLVFGPAPIGWTLRAGYWPTVIEGAVWLALVGGLVGLLVWRLAYRLRQ